MKRITADAVSPVVGVMLMLVVTIIIAAVVSAFAGGLTGSQQKTPQATLTATPVIQNLSGSSSYPPTYPSGEHDNNGILFENKGGDAFSLNDINIELDDNGVTMIIKSSDRLPSSTCLEPGITNGGYFQKIGNATTSDVIIAPGDKFMFYADNNQAPTSSSTGKLLWHVTGWGYAPINDLYTYSVIDKKSGRTIATGQFLLK
jgi:hypothetical protein